MAGALFQDAGLVARTLAGPHVSSLDRPTEDCVGQAGLGDGTRTHNYDRRVSMSAITPYTALPPSGFRPVEHPPLAGTDQGARTLSPRTVQGELVTPDFVVR